MTARVLLAALVALALPQAFALTPDEILTRHREKAAKACEKIDAVLVREGTALAAKAVSQGNTEAAKKISAQIQAKKQGQSVAAPEDALKSLFIMYDAARLEAITPIQEASLKELDGLLQSSSGKNMDTVLEIGKTRKQIVEGQTPLEGDSREQGLSKYEKTFVRKSWLSNSATEYYFEPDGKGYRLHGSVKTDLTWKVTANEVVEAQGFMAPGEPATFYFQFEDEDNGIFGRQSLNFMKDPIRTRRTWKRPEVQ